jgi:hypothetical protein
MKLVQVPVLRIKQCPDTSRWYRAHVGRLVPHRAWSAADGYKSTEPGGYTNFVRTEDAEPTTALVREADLAKWPYSHMQGRQLTPVTVAKPTPCAGSCEALGICQALADCQDKPRIDAQLAAKPKAAGQSRLGSAGEAVVNIAVGFGVSVVITAWLLPAMGHQVSLSENVLMTSVFTVASLIRSYAIRRAFVFYQGEK